MRKLGYSVTAVWNGRETLDYLIAANTPDVPYPKPDVILMDVQMPVIDGYRTTHLIRHHEPYKSTSGTIPIVAITASAVQGEREKCMRAGMDDYVAKPVKGKTLERMLDRWAVHSHARRMSDESDYPYSECTEDVAHRCAVSSSADRHLSTSSDGEW
jgi:CheY-like chemotaxis protein